MLLETSVVSAEKHLKGFELLLWISCWMLIPPCIPCTPVGCIVVGNVGMVNLESHK